QFDQAMKLCRYSDENCNGVQNPTENRRNEQKTEQPHPHRSDPVEHPHRRAGVPKGKDRSRKKSEGQNPENDFQPQWPGRTTAHRRERPGLINKKMRQEKDGLGNRNKRNKASSSHPTLDSSTQMFGDLFWLCKW